MKRYEINHRYVGGLGVEENAQGEWVRWEDVENLAVAYLNLRDEMQILWGDGTPTPTGFLKTNKL